MFAWSSDGQDAGQGPGPPRLSPPSDARTNSSRVRMSGVRMATMRCPDLTFRSAADSCDEFHRHSRSPLQSMSAHHLNNVFQITCSGYFCQQDNYYDIFIPWQSGSREAQLGRSRWIFVSGGAHPDGRHPSGPGPAKNAGGRGRKQGTGSVRSPTRGGNADGRHEDDHSDRLSTIGPGSLWRIFDRADRRPRRALPGGTGVPTAHDVHLRAH